MGVWLLAAVVVSTVLVFGFRAAARSSFRKGRGPLELAAIQASVQERISPEIFTEVWSKIGEAFSIDPRLIRPDDTLEKLGSVDSWDLGKGGDAIDSWLEQKRLGTPPPLQTVLDVARWIQSNENKAV